MIQKTTVLANGATGTYWVADAQTIYMLPNQAGVTLSMSLYTNRAAYVAGAGAIDRRDYELIGLLNPVGTGALVGLIEPALIANVKDFVSGTVVH